MTKLELLAPARNADIGIAAIRCGADAVYIGGPGFGARKAAGNSISDIKRLCEEAAKFKVRIFVTVNTLCKDDEERRDAVDMMLRLKDTGISAFILQDCTLLPMLQEYGPWAEEFHASTQCAIRSAERALELVQMGFHRLILERELSLDTIRDIREAIPAEVDLEFFVHGALCVCYSGDCYLSEYLTGRSANRGECAQPCRNLFDLMDESGKIIIKDKPLLSLKDFRLIDHLEALAQAGVISFKIEGRLKNESYVKNVVRSYSQALDSLVSKHPDIYCRSSIGKVTGGFTANLDKTFNRGYTSLFIDGRRGDWNSGDLAKGVGEYLGTIQTVFQRAGTMTVGIQPVNKAVTLHSGDGLCMVDRHGRAIGTRAETAQGTSFTCKSTEGLRESLKIWRNRDNEFERELERNMPQRLIGATIDVAIDSTCIKFTATSPSGASATESIALSECPVAQNRERMLQMLNAQLGKNTDIYSFEAGSLPTDGAQLPLLSAAQINGIRRCLAEQLGSLAEVPGASGKPFPTPIHPHESASLEHKRREGELMRTKYCLLHQLGKCLKQTGGAPYGTAKNGLYLINNGKKLRLVFDCKNCEMVIKSL